MKYLTLIAAASVCLLTASINLTSCVTTTPAPTLSVENTEQVILRAEQTAQTARLTFNTLVHLERDNEAMLKQVNPKIHEYANVIRRNGLDWITSLRNSTKAFKVNRNAENKASLDTAISTVQSAVSEANKYINQSKAAIP